MASNQTFQKRQKEMARKERQRAKAERKQQKKSDPKEQSPGIHDDDTNLGENYMANLDDLVSPNDSET